jgi:hypothetical protein
MMMMIMIMMMISLISMTTMMLLMLRFYILFYCLGLQGMNCGYEEVRAVIEALNQQMRAADDMPPLLTNPFTSTTTTTTTSTDTTTSLKEAIDDKRDLYSRRDIGFCIYALSQMPRSTYSEIDSIVEELNFKIAKSKLGGYANLIVVKSNQGVSVKHTI